MFRTMRFRTMRARATVAAATCAVVATGCVATGCGAKRDTQTVQARAATRSATTATVVRRPAAPRAGLRIGVVGPLAIRVPGAVLERGRLTEVAGDALVTLSAERVDLATAAAAADAHPTTHFALVGASASEQKRPNLLGLVLDERQAAQLGGVVAGLVAAEQGGQEARVAWVGPQERALAAAFAHGAQGVRPGTVVLRAWSRDDPAACKEAALGAIGRGAVAVMAHRGSCAAAATEGAHQQNLVALRISDFELPDVAAEIVVRDAVAGVYRGGEDVVFDASSGAIGVRHLDARVSADLAVRARSAAQELANGLRPTG
jgi:basic membrane lipoprotein Med (substrate-binding protein (PBP1-ABC) superfamily)